MSSVSIRNMSWVMGMRELNTQTAHDAMMSNLLAIMDVLTLEEYDAFVDAGPDGNAEFAQYVAAKRAELEARKTDECSCRELPDGRGEPCAMCKSRSAGEEVCPACGGYGAIETDAGTHYGHTPPACYLCDGSCNVSAQKAAEFRANRSAELPDSFTTPAVTDADEADRQDMIGWMRNGQ